MCSRPTPQATTCREVSARAGGFPAARASRALAPMSRALGWALRPRRTLSDPRRRVPAPRAAWWQRVRRRSRARRHVIVTSHVRKDESPRKPESLRHARMNASWETSSASSRRPSAAYAVRNTSRRCASTSAPKAAWSPARAWSSQRCTSAVSRVGAVASLSGRGSVKSVATVPVTGAIDAAFSG
jgi:hypothetical protein